jgi:hypothetical protein
MRRLKEVYRSRFLKWSDIGKVGESAVLTVTGADYEALKNPATGEEKEKLILDVAEFEEGLVCNVTNADFIVASLGTDLPTDWIGAKLRVVVEMVQMGTQKVEGMRVRAVKPPPGKAQPSPQPKTQPAAAPPARDDGDPGPSDEDFGGIQSDDIPVNF